MFLCVFDIESGLYLFLTSAVFCCQVTAKGPGLEPTGVTVNKWAEFTVDTRRAGKAKLHIGAMDADYNPVDVVINDNKDGTYRCRYMPKNPLKHTIIISYGGKLTSQLCHPYT